MLSGCSWLVSQATKLLTAPKTSNTANLAIGDNKHLNTASVGNSRQHNKNNQGQAAGKNITNGNVYHKETSFYLIILLILGWCLPTPIYMWKKWRNRR